MSDECPVCREELTNYCLDHELGAGDSVKCPGCGGCFTIIEHSDGWQNWMTFTPDAAAPL